MIQLVFESAAEMRNELLAMGYQFVGVQQVVGTLSSPAQFSGTLQAAVGHTLAIRAEPPIQSADEQCDALDAVFRKVDEHAAAVKQQQEIAEQTNAALEELTTTEETVEEVTELMVREACLAKAPIIGSEKVFALLKDEFGAEKVADIPKDRLAEALKKVNDLA